MFPWHSLSNLKFYRIIVSFSATRIVRAVREMLSPSFACESRVFQGYCCPFLLLNEDRVFIYETFLQTLMV